jgi:hypothetical protein
LKHKEIFTVGLGRRFLSYLSNNNSLNPVGFGSVLLPLATTNRPELACFFA